MIPYNRYTLTDDGPTPVSKNAWAVTYAGVAIKLLCFFIVLYTYSIPDTSKYSVAAKSFSTAVGALSGGQRFEPGKTPLPVTPDMVPVDSEIAGIQNNAQEIADELGMGNDIKVSVRGKGVVLQLSDKILFDAGQAEIRTEARKLMDHVGTIVTNYPSYNLRIEGHTDNTPIHTERYPSNWELSTSRAVNVVRYLMDRRMIRADRLLAAGFGEFKPIYPNDTPENRARNRRVELYFFRDDKHNFGN